jgi:transposase-like protein
MGEEYPKTLLEFEKQFADEAACWAYLSRLRWPDGFVCPACSGKSYLIVRRARWRCDDCGRETSVTSGTVFQDTKLPLTLWFRAMWQVTCQKSGVSAMGLQRALGLGSYKTAWTMLHKLRRAMVRPGRDRLKGIVEVDETYYGAPNKGIAGRHLGNKALIIIAAEVDGPKIGRVRMRTIAAANKKNLHPFITDSIAPGSTVHTDGLQSYDGLRGFVHQRHPQSRQADDAEHVLPRVHRVITLLKRWLLGTHQGAVDKDYLQDYLDEFTFRFNRRTSAARGKLFYRLAQQAVQIPPTTFEHLRHHNP